MACCPGAGATVASLRARGAREEHVVRMELSTVCIDPFIACIATPCGVITSTFHLCQMWEAILLLIGLFYTVLFYLGHSSVFIVHE